MSTAFLPAAFTIEKLCQRYPVSRTYVYEELKAGKLRGLKVNGRRVILSRDAEDWWNSKVAEAQASAG